MISERSIGERPDDGRPVPCEGVESLGNKNSRCEIGLARHKARQVASDKPRGLIIAAAGVRASTVASLSAFLKKVFSGSSPSGIRRRRKHSHCDQRLGDTDNVRCLFDIVSAEHLMHCGEIRLADAATSCRRFYKRYACCGPLTIASIEWLGQAQNLIALTNS
jgi:hypothetical protein